MTESNGNTKFHILIVEDDITLANGLCRALQNDRTEAVGCHTLAQAAELLDGENCQDSECGDMVKNDDIGMLPEDVDRKQTAWDLVILDVNLPDGNGFDFLREIKKEYDIFVIMLTANDIETDIVTGLEMGADDYITKPFSLAVLRARVATQLRRAEAGKSTGAYVKESEKPGQEAEFGSDGDWITDGEYRFHFTKMLFYHGAEQIELSKGEQKLLRFLVENRGITLSRDKLLECIWSVDAAFVDENTLSVTVKRLRDKLSAQDKIKTVYGIGYRWE